MLSPYAYINLKATSSHTYYLNEIFSDIILPSGKDRSLSPAPWAASHWPIAIGHQGHKCKPWSVQMKTSTFFRGDYRFRLRNIFPNLTKERFQGSVSDQSPLLTKSHYPARPKPISAISSPMSRYLWSKYSSRSSLCCVYDTSVSCFMHAPLASASSSRLPTRHPHGVWKSWSGALAKHFTVQASAWTHWRFSTVWGAFMWQSPQQTTPLAWIPGKRSSQAIKNKKDKQDPKSHTNP